MTVELEHAVRITVAEAAAPRHMADEDLRLLLTIRRFEQSLLDLFSEGRLNGTTHTCLGQEYIPVALRTLLDDRDFLFSNHRGHGHYLARFDDPEGLLAEIMGRQGAVCNGVGGSQHLHRSGYLSTGVQGESLPVAAGVAFHLARLGEGGLAAVFIGDGTWGEGSVYEALNMAGLWRLPLLVVVENNGIAQTTPTALEMSGTIEARATAFEARFERITSREPDSVRGALADPIARVREGEGPLVVEFVTDRLGPHSKGDDTRDPALLEEIRDRDWYRCYRRAYPDQCSRLEEEADARIGAVIEEVEARGASRWEGDYAW